MKKLAKASLCCMTALSLCMPFTVHAQTDYSVCRTVFDPQYYYDQNPDLQELLGNDPERLFQHFITIGMREGRSGIEDFNLKAYVFYNEDLVDFYKTDLPGYCKHYMEMGKDEGRTTTFQGSKPNLIGTYSTYYDPTLPRATNIALAVERINGITLQPQEAFSFSNAVLPRRPEYGYVMAPAIGGMEYGGGICQVSSTLYAATCHALFPVTERHPHSSRVSYLPEGLDATISEGYKDLKFVNIYGEPLIIQADAREGCITVSLWLGSVDATDSPDNQDGLENSSGQETVDEQQNSGGQETADGQQDPNGQETADGQEDPSGQETADEQQNPGGQETGTGQETETGADSQEPGKIGPGEESAADQDSSSSQEDPVGDSSEQDNSDTQSQQEDSLPESEDGAVPEAAGDEESLPSQETAPGEGSESAQEAAPGEGSESAQKTAPGEGNQPA